MLLNISYFKNGKELQNVQQLEITLMTIFFKPFQFYLIALQNSQSHQLIYIYSSDHALGKDTIESNAHSWGLLFPFVLVRTLPKVEFHLMWLNQNLANHFLWNVQDNITITDCSRIIIRGVRNKGECIHTTVMIVLSKRIICETIMHVTSFLNQVTTTQNFLVHFNSELKVYSWNGLQGLLDRTPYITCNLLAVLYSQLCFHWVHILTDAPPFLPYLSAKLAIFYNWLFVFKNQ